MHLAEKWGLFPVTVLTSVAAGMIFCNQSIMVMMSQPLMKRAYEQQGASREHLAVDLENSAIVLAAVIPWNLACSIPHQMLGAGPGAASRRRSRSRCQHAASQTYRRCVSPQYQSSSRRAPLR